MRRIAEVIVVEGKYDKNTLSQAVDASVVTLEGFAAFHDREKLSFLHRLAEKRGLIVLTDSDGAGFVLRNFLKGALPPERVKHAYIPDIHGKERRKRTPGREGKLGVEGMRPEILLDALRRAGATFLDESPREKPEEAPITISDFFAWGLTGAPDSAERRRALLKRLSLPEKLSTHALLDALNLLYGRERFREVLRAFKRGDDGRL
ncbi:MAG: DUF4093 domain-containing protein [Oscillibacter sp.]|nr:DUF4093 domain-containing protein [Oscillibacter sp.]